MEKSLPKPLKKRSGKKRSFMRGQAAPKIAEFLSYNIILRFIFAFFMSRTAFIGGASPMGFSLFAASFNSGGGYICAIGAILGLIFSGKGILQVGKYIIAIILFSLIQERFLPEKHKKAVVNAALGSVCVLVSGFFLLFADVTLGGYPLIYDSVVLIVECATIWISALAFSISLPLILNLGIRRTLSAEETVSFAVISYRSDDGIG